MLILVMSFFCAVFYAKLDVIFMQKPTGWVVQLNAIIQPFLQKTIHFNL